ncbi:MAG: L-histidine N(alpha)-methyltransferase [Synechococcaceae cyanobacterium RL_1_2]|nr:L-histidine N(alpha)-methyltransferase [Synechococcaceae cyanobacterium RL_1_2]
MASPTSSSNLIKIINLDTTTSTQARDGQDVIDGLSQPLKTISPKYLYDDRGSHLFEQICELPEYYPTRTEDLILQTAAPAIAALTGGCDLIELGSGSSTKTRRLIEAYLQINPHTHYFPIDISGGMLEASAKVLHRQYPSLDVTGLVGTYEQALNHLPPTDRPRLLFFLGSSLGNFSQEDCDRFFDQLDRVLTPGDYFLLGLDLQKSKDILESAYNDSQGITVEFNLNILRHLNWRFNGDFKLHNFEHLAFYNDQLHQIEIYLTSLQAQTVHVEKLGLTVTLAEGEKIFTEISRKFDVATMTRFLEQKQFSVIKNFTDPHQWFSLLLCQFG